MARPVPWLVPAVAVGALSPLAVIGVDVATRALGANPVSEVLNQLGLLTLITLLLTLACTPLKVFTGWTWPPRIRRTLGLVAFAYACLHFLTYSVVDQNLSWSAIWKDITKRWFIFLGMAGLTLLIPLAITSTNAMVRRLGFVNWKRLHRLAYVAGILGVVHFILRVKRDRTEPYTYAAILGFLFLIRGVDALRRSGRPSTARAGRAPEV